VRIDRQRPLLLNLGNDGCLAWLQGLPTVVQEIIADPKVNQMENVTFPVQQGRAEPGTLSRFREQYLSG
jgi:hypothetical protein